jgi:chromate transporter
MGILAITACKLTVRNVGTDKLLWAIYRVVAAVTTGTVLPAWPNPPMI